MWRIAKARHCLTLWLKDLRTLWVRPLVPASSPLAPSKVLDSSPAPVMYSVQAPPTVMYSIQAPPPVIYSVQAPPPSDALPLVMSHLHQMPTNNPTKCSSNVRPRGTSLV